MDKKTAKEVVNQTKKSPCDFRVHPTLRPHHYNKLMAKSEKMGKGISTVAAILLAEKLGEISD